MARNKENATKSRDRGWHEGEARAGTYVDEGADRGGERRGQHRRRWRMPGTNAKTCLHLRGLRTSGVGTRHEMEEIRRKTAELDKPAGFVLSGVRNEGKHELRPRYRVVDGHRPDHRVSRRTSRSPARSLVRSPACGNRQSASPRQALAPLTSAGSMGRNGSAG